MRYHETGSDDYTLYIPKQEILVQIASLGDTHTTLGYSKSHKFQVRLSQKKIIAKDRTQCMFKEIPLVVGYELDETKEQKACWGRVCNHHVVVWFT